MSGNIFLFRVLQHTEICFTEVCWSKQWYHCFSTRLGRSFILFTGKHYSPFLPYQITRGHWYLLGSNSIRNLKCIIWKVEQFTELNYRVNLKWCTEIEVKAKAFSPQATLGVSLIRCSFMYKMWIICCSVCSFVVIQVLLC
jgi:hypothetical protein